MLTVDMRSRQPRPLVQHRMGYPGAFRGARTWSLPRSTSRAQAVAAPRDRADGVHGRSDPRHPGSARCGRPTCVVRGRLSRGRVFPLGRDPPGGYRMVRRRGRRRRPGCPGRRGASLRRSDSLGGPPCSCGPTTRRPTGRPVPRTRPGSEAWVASRLEPKSRS